MGLHQWLHRVVRRCLVWPQVMLLHICDLLGIACEHGLHGSRNRSGINSAIERIGEHIVDAIIASDNDISPTLGVKSIDQVVAGIERR